MNGEGGEKRTFKLPEIHLFLARKKRKKEKAVKAKPQRSPTHALTSGKSGRKEFGAWCVMSVGPFETVQTEQRLPSGKQST